MLVGIMVEVLER